jgi:NADPH-dependent F420 reductase
VRVGVLGGTGPAGRALSARLAASGVEVVIGSRDIDRCIGVRDRVLDRWPDRDLPLEAAENPGAAKADLVVVATPWDAAADTAGSLATELEGKVVVSMANALTKAGDGFSALIPSRGSVAAAVQAALPGSLVSAAFHHLPARTLGDLDTELDADVLVCADAPEATAATSELVECIPGLRALDAGGLHSAGPVEALTAVLLQLNVRYKAKAGVRITGIS